MDLQELPRSIALLPSIRPHSFKSYRLKQQGFWKMCNTSRPVPSPCSEPTTSSTRGRESEAKVFNHDYLLTCTGNLTDGCLDIVQESLSIPEHPFSIFSEVGNLIVGSPSSWTAPRWLYELKQSPGMISWIVALEPQCNKIISGLPHHQYLIIHYSANRILEWMVWLLSSTQTSKTACGHWTETPHNPGLCNKSWHV